MAFVVIGQTAWSMATTSGSYDETTYLQFARDAYDRRTAAPLADSGIAPLPVIIEYAIPVVVRPGYVASIAIARIVTLLLIGLPLVVLVYWWLLRESGPVMAAAGAGLVALSPNIIANLAIATTDAAFILFALIALVALRAWLDTPSPRTFILLAAAVAAAMAAKYSAVGLFAIVPISWLAMRLRAGTRPADWLRDGAIATALTAALIATTFVALWVLHGFGSATVNMPGVGWMTAPAPIAGVMYQVNHQRGGHFAFLFGQLSTTGWWYYLPVALALKSTPAELLTFGIGLAAMRHGWRTCSTSALVWRVALVIYGLLALVNRVAAGVRYILLIIPLLILVAADDRARAAIAPRRLWIAAALLVVAQATSSLRIGPHYLSYFNVFAGGPSQGRHYLADSNIDWGQDLPALRRTLEQVGARRPVLAFFGTAPLDAYGVAAFEWKRGRLPPDGGFDWIAISTTYLNGAYLSHDPFERFRALAPSARAAYSMLLYDISRPDVRLALDVAEARMAMPSH